MLTDAQWDRYFIPTPHIGTPRGWSKSAAILAKKIHGRYWMYFGDTYIWAAYSHDLREWEVVNEPVLFPREGCFDERRLEPGPPPLVTNEGIWLGYNGADATKRYAFGQALFDSNDPTRLLRRSNRPLLEPTRTEEINGPVDRVVYGQGLVQFGNQWLLYYGMADGYIGLAMTPLPQVCAALQTTS
jgi:predicted GH43/DUF377 family glycosyl hydrolase